MDLFEKLAARKRAWQPTYSPKENIHPKAFQALSRCLALRCLEVPVGEWVSATLVKAGLPDSALTLMLSNIPDEDKHDLVLNHLAQVNEMTNEDAEGQQLAEQWLNHGDHPITKAAVLESSIFFVILPMMRFLGTPGMRTVANDISNDESIHAPCNRAIAKTLGYKVAQSLDKLRVDTVAWITEPLSGESKWHNKEIWRLSSDSLLMTGKAPLLMETKAARMISPYEMHNSKIPRYN